MDMRGEFIGALGRRIVFRRWNAPDNAPEKARGALVIAHGYGEHSGRYQNFAQWMAARGYHVFALDHHGHGLSDGTRALITSFDEAAADIGQMIALASKESGFRRPALLGHSMGGALALYYTLANPETLSALVLSGPAIGGAPAGPMRALAALLARLAPQMGVKMLEAEAISRDPAVVAAYRDDPLVTLGRIPARTAHEIIAAMASYKPRMASLTLPLLYLHGSADRLVPQREVQAVIDLVPAASKTEIVYPGLYHEILNEPEREKVYEDIADWLSAAPQLSARLSEAPDDGEGNGHGEGHSAEE